jgi:hypothetical protein
MEHLWAIVGTGVRPQTETDFVVLQLFGDEGGRGPRTRTRDVERDPRLTHDSPRGGWVAPTGFRTVH